MKLVIVESPAKAKTISKFLGKEYEVDACYGHVRDLPGSAEETPEEIKKQPWSRLAVNIEEDFEPYYIIPDNSKKHVANLKKKLARADELLLATDEDREGESISWHLLEVLKPKVPVRRIAFHEITKTAIQEAIKNPRSVDDKLVRAQESRRILDRLYGYSLSPVLWKKVRTKLSAGRVQSVAVRLIVEREEERRAFVKSVYWDVEAKLRGQGLDFPATLMQVGADKLASSKDFDSTTGKLNEKAKTIALNEKMAAQVAADSTRYFPWRVEAVERKAVTQRPAPPFTTSTLQQAASSRLGFTTKRTMEIAQRLYEGVDLGEGEREGLITYMRTDSVTLSQRALGEAAEAIKKMFGAEYHQGTRQYTTKSKSAQEAHEAIRPSEMGRAPEKLAKFLDKEELALYRLIWSRAIASQMADAQLERTSVDFRVKAPAQEYLYRSNGSVVKFAGYLKAYGDDQKDTVLPELREGQEIHSISKEKPSANSADPDTYVVNAEPRKHETQPPARYTEASLVKKLEEEGIGRPSTYAPTISTIQQRGYVDKKGSALVPTFLAIAVTNLLRDHFDQYVDLKFTARMEEDLDNIAAGEEDWIKFLGAFYRGAEGKGGETGLDKRIQKEMPRIEFPAIPVGADPDSGEALTVRIGKTSAFIHRGEGGPENTVTIPEGVLYEDLTPEKASELLKAKKEGSEGLGEDPDTGMRVYVLTGRFGPFVQLGEAKDKTDKPKRASLPKGMNVGDMTLPIALKLLALPRELGKHPETGDTIVAAVGRFGPYVRHGDAFRSLEPTDDVYTIDLERALALIATPKAPRRQAAARTPLRELGAHPETGEKISVMAGQYGPYVTDGKKNATIKEQTPEDITLAQAVELLENAKPGKKSAKKSSWKSAAKKTATPAPKKTTKKTTRKSAKKSEE